MISYDLFQAINKQVAQSEYMSGDVIIHENSTIQTLNLALSSFFRIEFDLEQFSQLTLRIGSTILRAKNGWNGYEVFLSAANTYKIEYSKANSFAYKKRGNNIDFFVNDKFFTTASFGSFPSDLFLEFVAVAGVSNANVILHKLESNTKYGTIFLSLGLFIERSSYQNVVNKYQKLLTATSSINDGVRHIWSFDTKEILRIGRETTVYVPKHTIQVITSQSVPDAQIIVYDTNNYIDTSKQYALFDANHQQVPMNILEGENGHVIVFRYDLINGTNTFDLQTNDSATYEDISLDYDILNTDAPNFHYDIDHDSTLFVDSPAYNGYHGSFTSQPGWGGFEIDYLLISQGYVVKSQILVDMINPDDDVEFGIMKSNGDDLINKYFYNSTNGWQEVTVFSGASSGLSIWSYTDNDYELFLGEIQIATCSSGITSVTLSPLQTVEQDVYLAPLIGSYDALTQTNEQMRKFTSSIKKPPLVSQYHALLTLLKPQYGYTTQLQRLIFDHTSTSKLQSVRFNSNFNTKLITGSQKHNKLFDSVINFHLYYSFNIYFPVSVKAKDFFKTPISIKASNTKHVSSYDISIHKLFKRIYNSKMWWIRYYDLYLVSGVGLDITSRKDEIYKFLTSSYTLNGDEIISQDNYAIISNGVVEYTALRTAQDEAIEDVWKEMC